MCHSNRRLYVQPGIVFGCFVCYPYPTTTIYLYRLHNIIYLDKISNQNKGPGYEAGSIIQKWSADACSRWQKYARLWGTNSKMDLHACMHFQLLHSMHSTMFNFDNNVALLLSEIIHLSSVWCIISDPLLAIGLSGALKCRWLSTWSLNIHHWTCPQGNNPAILCNCMQ